MQLFTATYGGVHAKSRQGRGVGKQMKGMIMMQLGLGRDRESTVVLPRHCGVCDLRWVLNLGLGERWRGDGLSDSLSVRLLPVGWCVVLLLFCFVCVVMDSN